MPTAENRYSKQIKTIHRNEKNDSDRPAALRRSHRLRAKRVQFPAPFALRETARDLRDIVFLGNSITDGGEWNELLANPRVKNRGISGDRSSWMLDRLDPIVGGQPRKLFLLIGTNDLAAGTPAAEVVANVRKIVERFQSESPRTKLYVQSVFPVNDSFKKYAAKHGRHDADIVAVNKGLQALCAEKGIVYIDLWTLLADKNGKLRADLTNDGLHLMGEGCIVWRDAVLPYVK